MNISKHDFLPSQPTETFIVVGNNKCGLRLYHVLHFWLFSTYKGRERESYVLFPENIVMKMVYDTISAQCILSNVRFSESFQTSAIIPKSALPNSVNSSSSSSFIHKLYDKTCRNTSPDWVTQACECDEIVRIQSKTEKASRLFLDHEDQENFVCEFQSLMHSAF